MSNATHDGKEAEPSTSSSVQWSQPCHHFEFSEIMLATNNFDESLVIGRGGFGKVYKGNIMNGSTIVIGAIKRLDSMSSQGAAEFWTEVEMLSKLRHCHLVSLFGYCNYEKEMMLVYEYMPNGTLEDHLHKLCTPLSWLQRLKICLGAARGLDYLHTGTGIEFGVIHRDIKSSNILLHESWAAKLSDFGLSRIGPTNQPSTYVNTLVKGTFGYLDPNYFRTGRLTRKSDVYAFGVVLLEVLCRKRAVDTSLDEDQWGLVEWAQDSVKEGNLKHIIDSEIRCQISPKCLKEFVQVAQRCFLSNPKQRPTMAEVVVSLESVLTLQEKINSSLQSAGRTIFGRLLDMFPFSSKSDKSAHGDAKLSSNINVSSRTASNTVAAANNTIVDVREVASDFKLPTDPSLKVFKFADLESATSNFSQDLLLGSGYFGKMFLGWVDQNTFTPSRCGDGIAVVIKKPSSSRSQRHDKWLADVSLLGQLAHPNIVSLLGYCSDEHENLLVYEYMANRSFDRFLFTSEPDITEPLSWGTRLQIMIGVARGLTYLHSSKDQVVCRGVKICDILLDQDFNPKLVDFGLAKSGIEMGETIFSVLVIRKHVTDPEYMMTGRLSVKSDIYSFGVVFLEALTGLRIMDVQWHVDDHNLIDWASSILADRRELKNIMDPRLEDYPEEGAFECAALILDCLATRPKDRPSSEKVLWSLERIYAIYT